MMARQRPALAACALFTATLLSAGTARADDLEKMQGLWKVTYAEIGGRPATAKELKSVTIKIDGKKLTLNEGDKKEEVFLKLDHDATPHSQVEFWRGKQSEGNKAFWHGIYEFDGSRLKLCWGPANKTRPGGFGSKKAENRYYILTK
jgi:uncharacterized protein (TIGR03067 family)